MASDFGDESGQRLLDDFVRFGQQTGIEAMRERAYALRRACENARDGVRGDAGARDVAVPGAGDPREWAKLDMREFQEIKEYERIKGVIESKLAAHGAEFHWHADGDAGREFLLFRVRDAREVWESFGELAREADEACGKAAEVVRQEVAREGRDGRDDAPPGAWHQAEHGADLGDAPPGARHQAARGRVRARRNGDHAKSVFQKYGVPVLRDLRPLEERAAHARAVSAALPGEGPTTRERGLGPRMQEVRSK